MEVIALDGDKVTDYTRIMYNHLKDMVDEIKLMEALENDVIWKSPAGLVGIESYKKIIVDYIDFANRMMTFIDYLEGYVNGYDELVEEVKEHYRKLNEKYNIEEEKYGKLIEQFK